MAELANISYTLVTSPRIAESPSTVDEVTVQDALDTLSAKQDDIDVIGATPAIDNTVLVSGSGKDDLGGGVSVGITSTFDNLQWAFASDYTATESGTATSAGTTTLIDTLATFVTNGVTRGAAIINYDDKSITEVLTVDSEIQLTHRALNNGIANDWTIGDNYTVHNIVQKSIAGGNQVAVDSAGDPLSPVFPTAFTQVLLTASSSATLANQSQLEAATFIGKDGLGISIAATTGTDSSVYPSGIEQSPCKTEANLHAIHSVRGYRRVYVKESLTLTTDHSADKHIWYGDNPQTATITLDPACDVTDNKFQDAYITGKLDSGNELRECIVNGVTNANGFIYNCTIVGPIVVSDDLSMQGCWVAPSVVGQEITIDFNSLANTVLISQWGAGRVIVKNMITGSFLGMTGSAGIIKIDSVNAGGIVGRGGGILLDPTSDTAAVDTVQDFSIPSAVWDDPDALTLPLFVALK